MPEEKKKPAPMWLNRHPILKEEDADWLETQAAVHEFSGNGYSREEAEGKAHADYKKKHSAMAAAHHLAGMRSAIGEDAKQHGIHYAMHVKELGHDPSGPVPDEVKAHMNSAEFKHPVKFKAHHADSFLMHDPEATKGDVDKAEEKDYLELLLKTVKMAVVMGELAKGLTAPGAPELHSTVEGFANGLRMHAKGTPERAKFIQRHMNHGPFLSALQAHPQGKALHGQLMQIVNSPTHAGFKAGATVATAKIEMQ